jgi:hypothetical protein
LLGIGERKDIYRIEETGKWTRRTRRQREPIVETSAATA